MNKNKLSVALSSSLPSRSWLLRGAAAEPTSRSSPRLPAPVLASVKMGSEKAAKDYKVKINFSGPENESQVDKQIEMLQAELAKKPPPSARRTRFQGAIPLLQKAQARTSRWSASTRGGLGHPSRHRATDNMPLPARPRTHGQVHRRLRRGGGRHPRPDSRTASTAGWFPEAHEGEAPTSRWWTSVRRR